MDPLTHRSGRIAVWAARGGHGATTIAGALGVFLGTHVRSHDPEALSWMWGLPQDHSGSVSTTVFDAGVLAQTSNLAAVNVAVLRGPCLFGLRSLSRAVRSIDFLVLVTEPWRSIHRADVEAALSMTVSVDVAFSPRAARLADAGCIRGRIQELDEFAELRELANSWMGTGTR